MGIEGDRLVRHVEVNAAVGGLFTGGAVVGTWSE